MATETTGRAEPPAVADAPVAPGWFRARAESDRPQSDATASPPPLDFDPDAPITRVRTRRQSKLALWRSRILVWAVGLGGIGYGLSLLVHGAAFLIFSLVVYGSAGRGGFDSMLSLSGGGGGRDGEIGAAIDTSLGTDTLLEQPSQPIQFDAVGAVDPNAAQAIAVELQAMAGGDGGSGGGSGGGEGDGEGDGIGGGAGGGFEFRMPEGGRVVTKGSFTAWTVPEDPLPGQDYVIVIQIKLPTRTKRYRVNDLSGIVVGTDGYQQRIPGPRGGELPIEKSETQLSIPVPGAARRVKDTIKVQSKLLKENQTLEIEF